MAFVGDSCQPETRRKLWQEVSNDFPSCAEMDVNRMKNDVKLTLCRKYYYAGFAVLPFLWAINAVWFFNDAFRKPHFEEQAEIRKYVIRSGIGALIWTGVFIAWTCVFQINRAGWGELGDQLSFVIPRGIP